MNPIWVRGSLYTAVFFITPFAEKIVPILNDGQWPKPQSLLACGIAGLLSAAIGLRAYLDTSVQKYATEPKTPAAVETTPATASTEIKP